MECSITANVSRLVSSLWRLKTDNSDTKQIEN